MNLRAMASLSWAALLTALAIWAGVGFFAWTIAAEESTHASRIAQAQEEAVRQSAALRLRALARETKDSRAQLEELAQRDVVQILDSIAGVARDAGIPIKIGQALSASGSASDNSLHTASFVIEAEGTFTQITDAIALLELLPSPSSLNELQFEQVPAGTGSGKSKPTIWRVIARMQFFTTADISS